jgi:molecular chaperone DnaK
MEHTTKPLIVGIDLGTTNSVVSYLAEDKSPVTLEVDSAKLLPSVVSLTDSGFIVGQTAKNMLVLEPTKTIASIKRKMGQDITFTLGKHTMRPEEISGLILKKIKQTVVQTFSLNENDVLRAVVTVPAYFTEEQRDATKQAAELAGLKVERIINEPTAAALAFGLSQMDEAVYAIYDFGGGTFDVSVIESNEGLIEVLASTGNNSLGGDDLDQLLADFIWSAFLKTNKLPLDTPCYENEKARLIRIAERTKIQLSDTPSVNIQESFFANIKGINYHLEIPINRSDFESLILSKVKETIEHLQKAVKEAGITFDNLNGIILVGGSSRIPMIAQMIEEQLNVVPILIDLPDEAVAHGAAIQGAIIDGVDIDTILVDITPHSLGIAVSNREERMEDMMAMLRGGGNLDKSLRAAVIISKNTPIPTKRSDRYFSGVPFQEKYHLKIFQGENPYFDDNKNIGETYLEVENPVEDGIVDVTFALDINGLLNVTAVEATTGETVQVVLKSSRGKKIREDRLKDLNIASDVTESDHTLLRRAESLLSSNQLNEEDKAELGELSQRFRTALSENAPSVSSIETELLDLLYYLENNG